MRQALSLFVAFTLVAVSPGLAPYQAAAGPFAEAGASVSWRPALGALVVSAQAGAPLPGDLSRVVGQLNVDLALNKTAAMSELAARLPEAYRSPQAFAGLPSAKQAELLAAAAAAARAELEGEASLLAQNASRLGELRVPRFQHLADCFYLFSPELARQLRAAVFDRRVAAVGQSAEAGARALRQQKDDSSGVVAAELMGLFEGVQTRTAARLISERLGAPAEKGAFAKDTLAPYSERALSDAAGRMAERGISSRLLPQALLVKHREVFGGMVSPGLIKLLRKRGDWTDFVASISILSAQALGPEDLAPELSQNDDLRIAIPAWHPLAGAHKTVAGWLASFHPEDKAEPESGVRILGIPVRADRSFLIALALVTFSLSHGLSLPLALAGAVVLYACVVAHEFGHALTARAFGIQTRSITLHILGGLAALDGESRTPLQEFLIAAAGPAVSLLLGFGFALLSAHAGAALYPVVKYLATANIGLAIFNMLPAYPMDGGRVARSALWGVTRDEYTATRLAGAVGMLFGLLFGIGGLVLLLPSKGGTFMLAMLGLFLFTMAKQSRKTPGTIKAPRE